MRFAEIIVDITSGAVDRRFTYSIPDGMELELGDMVKVPFGPRTLEGFVLALTDECGLPEEKIRAVREKRPCGRILNGNQIALAGWMKSRYNCTLAEALRQMIPAEIRGERVREKSVRVASLAVSGAEADEMCARAPKQKQVAALLAGGPKPVA